MSILHNNLLFYSIHSLLVCYIKEGDYIWSWKNICFKGHILSCLKSVMHTVTHVFCLYDLVVLPLHVPELWKIGSARICIF